MLTKLASNVSSKFNDYMCSILVVGDKDIV